MTEQARFSINGASSKDHNNILNSRLCRIRETNSIFKLLPFFEKICIFRMLVSNTEINTKAAVLAHYIEISVTQHHYINDNVFETLSRWQLNPNDSGLEENVNRHNDTRDLERCQIEEIDFIRELIIGSYLDDIGMKYDQCKTPAEMEKMTIDIYTQSMLQTYDVQLKMETTCNYSEASSSTADCIKPINLAPVDVKVGCGKTKEVVFMNDEDAQIVKSPSLAGQKNEMASTSAKFSLNNFDFGSLTNSLFTFLHDTNRYREYAMESNHVEAKEYVRKFDIIKTIIPDSSDYDIASHVLCCKTVEDLERFVDVLLESNYAPVSQVKKEDDAPNVIVIPPTENEDLVHRQIITMVNMFTDADPDYINMRVQTLNGDLLAFENLVSEMIANPNYPKYEDYMKKKKENEMRKKFIEGMSMEEFLDYFDGNEENVPTRRGTKRPPGTTPAEFDDAFLKERCYVQMLDKINAHKEQMENEKKIRFEEAKSSGELQECQCCCDDEVLLDDMSTCGGDPFHLFCNECIRRYSEEQIGQSKMEFFCFEGECKAPFQLPVLKKVLKSSIFSNLLKRKQADEIEAADIPDLVSCPFCNFATIMPNPEDKVLKCLNPECMKDSCRFCKEHNHVPFKCPEKKKDVEHRTYLEDEMTKAIVRQCYKCKKAFLKEDGCNKMVCPCGAMSCYVCKQPIMGYNHFNDTHSNEVINGRCPLYSNSLDLHAKELKNRVEELKKDGTHENLVHNPLSAPVPQPSTSSAHPVPPAQLVRNLPWIQPPEGNYHHGMYQDIYHPIPYAADFYQLFPRVVQRPPY